MYHKMIEQLPDHEYSIEQIKAENEKLKDELNTAEKAFYEKREADAYKAGYEDGKRDAVRHGYWIEDGDVQICSECGEEHEWAEYRAPYCDICGAKMDGGAELPEVKE